MCSARADGFRGHAGPLDPGGIQATVPRSRPRPAGGPTGGAAAWTASADALVMAIQPTTLNHRYTTPQKLFESLASGVPVVASDLPGMAAIVQATGAGVLCDPTSPDSIAAAIESIAWPRPPRNEPRCGRACAAHERYNWEAQVETLFGVYRETSRPARRRPAFRLMDRPDPPPPTTDAERIAELEATVERLERELARSRELRREAGATRKSQTDELKRVSARARGRSRRTAIRPGSRWRHRRRREAVRRGRPERLATPSPGGAVGPPTPPRTWPAARPPRASPAADVGTGRCHPAGPSAGGPRSRPPRLDRDPQPRRPNAPRTVPARSPRRPIATSRSSSSTTARATGPPTSPRVSRCPSR